MKSRFLFIVTCRVSIFITADFQKWMEKVHFPDLHKTGCFKGNPLKIRSLPAGDNFHTITYIHEMNEGEAGWEKYTNDFRSEMKKDFTRNWGENVQSGALSVVATVGLEEEVVLPVTDESHVFPAGAKV